MRAVSRPTVAAARAYFVRTKLYAVSREFQGARPYKKERRPKEPFPLIFNERAELLAPLQFNLLPLRALRRQFLHALGDELNDLRVQFERVVRIERVPLLLRFQPQK